jgi:benzylsuccinate CoA-transferase BbsF subunit
LRHRSRTGQGQFIEVAQLEATTSMLGEGILEYQLTGRVPEPRGNYDPDFAPHNNYPCAGDDEWVSIAVRAEEEWQSFCGALGSPDWSRDPRFADKRSRLTNSQELDRLVSAWTRRHSRGEVTQLLQQHGVAAMPVMNIEDQFADPHWQAREAYIDVEHPHAGTEWLYGMSWLLSGTPGSVRTPAPLLGQHNEYVFCQLLGLPAEELERLQSAQVVY